MKNKKHELLETYQEMIKDIPPFTSEQEKEYLRKAKEGDTEALNQMILANLHLVLRFAPNYSKDQEEVADLIQEGSIGLLRAIYEFDCTRESTFQDYAIWKIKGQFTDHFRKQGIIVYPANIIELARKIDKLQQHMSEQEIRQACNITDSEWALCQQLKTPLLSLNDIKQTPDTIDFMEQIDNRLYQESLSHEIKQVLETLPHKEYNIIKARYYTAQKELTYRDTADILGIPLMTCHNHFQKIKRKLRHNKQLQRLYQDR